MLLPLQLHLYVGTLIMQNTVFFQNIREEIIKQLREAESSIIVAVAWLTDPKLYSVLVERQRKNISVTLAVLDDRINRNSSIAWEQLTAAGGSLYWIPEGTSRSGSLHHKFCLIDGKTVINGSFNWTLRASSADENIVIISDEDMAHEFMQAFERLLSKHGHETTVLVDTASVMKRLTVIEQMLQLGDYDDVLAQRDKLRFAESLPEIAKLLMLLHREQWAEASDHIRVILSSAMVLTVYRAPYLEELCLQIRVLENQQVLLETELADMQKEIQRFDYEQEKAVGNLVRQYLDLKRQLYAARARLAEEQQQESASIWEEEAAQANRNYEDYEKAQEAHANQPEPVKLSGEKAKQLKTLYRKLSLLCHPDRVEDDCKAKATLLFQRLALLYETSDLEAMEHFALDINAALSSAVIDNSLQRQEQLERRVQDLQLALQALANSISRLSQSDAWQTLNKYPEWHVWFEQLGEELAIDIDTLNNELEALTKELV